MAGDRPPGSDGAAAAGPDSRGSVPANRRGRRRGRATPKGRQVDPAAQGDIRALLGDGPHRRDHLIEHLHLVQDRFGALHARHLAALAAEHRLSQAEVYEVATFYAHFDIVADGAAPPPPVTVRVCDSLSCELAGAVPLMAALEEGCPDGVRVVRAPCMGRCDTAPVAEVGHHHIDHATAETVLAAVASGDLHPRLPDYEDYAAYVASGGFRALDDCRTGGRTVEQAVETLNEAGLRGLGGAGFPTGRKWSIVRSFSGPRLMAVIADEGEPGTFKDRYYLERRPHQFLEGVLIAAWAVEAETVYIYLRDEYPAAREILLAEIARLEREGRIGPHHLELRGRGGGLHLRRGIVDARIDRGQARPSAAPSPVRRGGGPLRATDPGAERRDPLLGARDPRAGRRLVRGRRARRGEGPSQLLGLRAGAGAGGQARGGRDHRPRARRGALRRDAGGARVPGLSSGRRVGWILPASMADLPLEFGVLEKHGCLVGSHAVVILSDRDDMSAVALNLLRFFEDESCGQCTPCRVGTEKAVRLMERPSWDVPLLEDVSQTMADASICGLGQAAANPLLSVLRYFPEDVPD